MSVESGVEHSCCKGGMGIKKDIKHVTDQKERGRGGENVYMRYRVVSHSVLNNQGLWGCRVARIACSR
jgi:hypothetical protein